MRKLQYAIGYKFGRLQIIDYVPSPAAGTHCAFRCDCGEFIKRPLRHVKRNSSAGHSPCCGKCAIQSKSDNGKKRRTHGFSVDHRRLYDVHCQMMRRCYAKESADYANYGGRGIVVCREWHDMGAFIAWAIRSGYRPSVTIERIDVNGIYCPENCTWIANEKQAHNTRIVRKITIDGVTKVISEWAIDFGISKHTIKTRISSGWNEKDAVMIPAVSGRNQYWMAS